MLGNLVPFVQFKKCERHPQRSVNFSKVAAKTLLKLALPHGCFSRFLNGINDTKLRKTSHRYMECLFEIAMSHILIVIDTQ